MAIATSERKRKEGVYFAAGDYVGLGPRIIILIVDSVVLLLGLVALILGTAILQALGVSLGGLVAPGIISWVWSYEVLLKRSRFGTLGYWLMGCRIVNLQGEPPSLLMLSVRTVFWLFGPLVILFDLFWCGIDEDKQTLRDRYSSTCLVKRNAVPIGIGNIKFSHFFAAGFNLAYPHVAHPQTANK